MLYCKNIKIIKTSLMSAQKLTFHTTKNILVSKNHIGDFNELQRK